MARTTGARAGRVVAAMALGIGAAVASAPSALAVDHRPVVEVGECGEWTDFAPSKSCEWQDASRAERIGSLLDAAYIASLAVAMVAGFVVVK